MLWARVWAALLGACVLAASCSLGAAVPANRGVGGVQGRGHSVSLLEGARVESSLAMRGHSARLVGAKHRVLGAINPNRTMGQDEAVHGGGLVLQDHLEGWQAKRDRKLESVRKGATIRKADIGQSWSGRHHDMRQAAMVQNSVTEMLCIKRMSKDIGSKMFTGVQTTLRTTFIGSLGRKIMSSIIEPVVYVFVYIMVIILLLTVGRGFLIGMMRAQYFIVPPCLDMLVGPAVANGLTQRLSRTMVYTLGDALSELLLVNVLVQMQNAMEAFMSTVSTAQLVQKVVSVVSTHIAKDTSKMLKVMVVQGVTHTVIHDVTHKVIHNYYCDYCHWYNEYCEYCFYYGDLTWLHQMWSMGGEGDSNPFGGVNSMA